MKNTNEIKCHSVLDTESSTHAVSQRRQPTWKILNQVQDDGTNCYNGNSGFTLIELLVVVLIIGILAAVALPQYQKAVDKSRFSNLMAITNALAQANEVYYLANGEYTSDFEALSVDIPATSISGRTATFDWGTCRLSGQQEVICFATTHLNNAYSVYYTHSSFSSWANHTYCVALTNEAGSRFDKVCSSLGTFKQVANCSTGPCRVYTLK